MRLMRRLLLGDLDLTAYPFGLEFGGDLGSPENVYDVLVSLLSDGEISTSTRVGNRTMPFTILIEGATLSELATNEALLIAECEKVQNTLTIDPGDDYAPVTVFDVFRVQAVLQYDDNLEQANFRRYALTIPAWPYARGEDLVVTPAAPSATETVVDDGSSAANWTADAGTVASTSGVVVNTYTGVPGGKRSLIRTADLPLSGVQYVAVTWKSSFALSLLELFETATYRSFVTVNRVDAGSGYYTSFYQVPSGLTSVSAFTLRWTTPRGGATGTQTMSIDKVSTWTALPFIGTARQKAMSLVPGGSVKTQGSVSVSHATSALGKTIVYTHPSGTGYLPPLRRWRTAGNTVTSDSTLLSGAREPIGPASTVFRVPVTALPQGRVELWAWLRVTTGSLTRAPAYAIRAGMGAQTVAGQGGNYSIVFNALNTWELHCLGAMTSPPALMGPAGVVQIDLNENSGQVEIDEAYLFATEAGSLTVVDCGTGTVVAGGPSNRLWVDAPSLDQPMGGIYRGSAADRSDAFHAGSSADVWGVHDFDPAGASVFVATSAASDAAVSLEHYRRFHTHVADA